MHYQTMDPDQETPEQYNAIMAAIDDPIYICSADFRIEQINPAMAEKIPHTQRCKPCYTAVFGMDRQCPWCVLGRVLTHGKKIKAKIINPCDGRIYRTSHAPVYNATGSVAMVTIFREITPCDTLHEDLDPNRALSTPDVLSGDIAHDLNNILFPIIGLTETMLEMTSPENRCHKTLHQVLKASCRARDLVDRLLEPFSRPFHSLEPVDMGKIVKEAAGLIETSMPHRIQVVLEIPETGPRIRADATHLHQIAMNLITNACHAMKNRSGILRMTLADIHLTEDQASPYRLPCGHYAIFTVSDTGPGIAPDHIERVFDKHFTSWPDKKGTGLGLPLVRRLTNAYGGDIRASSNPGHGTAFTVHLPVDPPP
ncbi:MAG: PAS domain-containing sensor histidine kinase [Thermodesulfobacteriota bacterium]|nr:PAS domain-containing sensor histidine kinase [Thermodesulfobacteriota bacterium]